MNPILELLQKDGRLTAQEIAVQLGENVSVVEEKIAAWEDDGTVLGYQAVVDRDRAKDRRVSALIEVKITPERGGGFDRVASRIAKFDQVSTCFLMSGSYDLAVVVEGNDLREVASFVAQKLSCLEGVLSTATSFRLKAYKQNGLLASADPAPERLPVAP